MPYKLLNQIFLDKQSEIEEWFTQQWLVTPPAIYGSIDLRNATFKLAPVDMNLFPAGFNNLNYDHSSVNYFSECVKNTIIPHLRDKQKILIITENHTRNLYYWQSVYSLVNILTTAGYSTRLGFLPSNIEDELRTIELTASCILNIEPVFLHRGKISLSSFVPDLILLNNDLSTAIPEILKNTDQLIMPPPELGWSKRFKSNHFGYYNQVSKQLASLIDIDSWLISSFFTHCNKINFLRKEGEECLLSSVDDILTAIRKKYDKYQIALKPFVVIKADAGTYGMAVMTARDANDIRILNRKQRAHMTKSKGGADVNQVIIQEGIYTSETVGDKTGTAESVIYLMGKNILGGFYRINETRNNDENLNSPGMWFKAMQHEKIIQKNTYANEFYLYSIIGRLSMLAAAREIDGIGIENTPPCFLKNEEALGSV